MLNEINRKLRGHDFYPTAEEVAAWPKIYKQDGLYLDAIVYAHYFCGGSDWWVTEVSHQFFTDEEVPAEVFCYTLLGGYEQGEFGYLSLTQLEEVVAKPSGSWLPIWVERDLYWGEKSVKECLEEKRGGGISLAYRVRSALRDIGLDHTDFTARSEHPGGGKPSYGEAVAKAPAAKKAIAKNAHDLVEAGFEVTITYYECGCVEGARVKWCSGQEAKVRREDALSYGKGAAPGHACAA